MHATKIEKMAMDDFIRTYDLEGPFELIDGERRPILVTVFDPNFYARLLLRILENFALPRKLGNAQMEQTFVLTYDLSNWVTGSRQPDVSYYTRDRWKAYFVENPDYRSKPVVMVPDLAVEILSPTDNLRDAEDKADLYIADGVKLVWIIDPERRTVRVYEGETLTRLNDTKTLTGGAVLPGFSLNLHEFFDTDPTES